MIRTSNRDGTSSQLTTTTRRFVSNRNVISLLTCRIFATFDHRQVFRKLTITARSASAGILPRKSINLYRIDWSCNEKPTDLDCLCAKNKHSKEILWLILSISWSYNRISWDCDTDCFTRTYYFIVYFRCLHPNRTSFSRKMTSVTKQTVFILNITFMMHLFLYGLDHVHWRWSFVCAHVFC